MKIKFLSKYIFCLWGTMAVLFLAGCSGRSIYRGYYFSYSVFDQCQRGNFQLRSN